MLAESILEVFLKNQPDNIQALSLLAIAKLSSGKAYQAIDLFKKILLIDSNNYPALFNISNLMIKTQQFDLARGYIERAILLGKDNPILLNFNGIANLRLNNLKAAKKSFEKAIEIKNDYSKAYLNLSIIYSNLGKYKRAIEMIDKAYYYDNLPDYLFSKSLLHLLTGDFSSGWKLYEKRKFVIKSAKKFLFKDLPLWEINKNLDKKKIFIFSEQGLGDTIQFCRYLYFFKKYDVKIFLHIPEALKPLIKTLDVDFSYISREKSINICDYQIPLMSLPYAFKTRLDSIPSVTPYLSPVKKYLYTFEGLLKKNKKIKIGLSYSGNPNHDNDYLRSIPLENLIDVMNPSFDWFLIQKEINDQDKEIIKGQNHIFHQEMNFSQISALISSLDLIISVDTSIAHLAGALNKRLWLLLAFNPDFRWLLNRRDSPWYPSAVLFRQESFGDWNGVLNEVKKNLELLLI